MEQKMLVKTGRKEIDGFVSEKSVLDTVNIISELDTVKLTIPTAPDTAIEEYFRHTDTPFIQSRTDFDYLYESLMNKLTILGEKDEGIKTYLQHANYQRQMTELPALMSKLERATLKFDALKEPFKEVMKSVYSFVTENEIEMNKGKIGLFKPEMGPEIISIIEGESEVFLIAEYDKKWKNTLERHLNEFFDFGISPVYKTISHEEAAERKTLFGRKKKRVSIIIKELEDVKIQKYTYAKDENSIFPEGDFREKGNNLSSGLFIDNLVEKVKRGKLKREKFLAIMRILMNLPVIINNNLNNSQGELNSLFSEIQKDLVPKKEE